MYTYNYMSSYTKLQPVFKSFKCYIRLEIEKIWKT